jgi:hypothetical protein
LISTYFVAYIIATSIINVTSEIVIREIFCVEIYLNKVLSVENMGLTQPPIEWVAGALSLRLKWPGREADLSPPSSAKVKNVWSYNSTPQYALMAWCSDKN